MNDPYYKINEFDVQYLIQRSVDYMLNRELDALKNVMNCQKGFFWNFVEFVFLNLLDFDQLLGNLLLSYPKQMNAVFHEACIQSQQTIYESRVMDNPEEDTGWVANDRFVIRWSHLPVNLEVYKANLPKSSDTGRLVSVIGTVVRVNTPKMIEWEFAYQCAKCGGVFAETVDIETFELNPIPTSCKAQNVGPKCKSRSFVRISVASSSNSRDYQELKLQERVHQLLPGAMPRAIVCILLDDLAGKCHAGDDVTIVGVVTRRWSSSLVAGRKPEIELVLLGNNVFVNNEKRGGLVASAEQIEEFESFWADSRQYPLRGRNQIIQSICPQVYGLCTVKMAIAVVLAGGVPLVRESTSTRGESHLLMIGDPGTGKSQILKYAAKLATRSVLTTEIGSTSAGLTATAVKDVGGEWVLEAGALVLADGGICCIDEFSNIKHDDQTAIHEAMEQQSIHIAKAGLVCSLHTRCSLLAATNPRGKYDVNEHVSMNVSIGTPLLSRFDLVLVMLDEPDEQWDTTVSSFILKGRTQRLDEDDEHQQQQPCRYWSVEKLQTYFSWIKSKFFPEMSLECQEILKRYYHKQRQSDNADAARTTFRMLESLIRLAQGHAKLMNRNVCTIQDSVIAVFLMDTSMSCNSVGDGVSCINTARSFFSDDPDADYISLEARILQDLNYSVPPSPPQHTLNTSPDFGFVL